MEPHVMAGLWFALPSYPTDVENAPSHENEDGALSTPLPYTLG